MTKARGWISRVGLLSGFFLLPALPGCTALDRDANAEAIASPAGLRRTEIRAGDFVLTAFVRIADPKQPVNIYIEGDGLAWRSRSEPSLDPTPKDAIGLQLAALDPANNVAYIARACQFTPREKNPNCDVSYWTAKRYAPEVVVSMDQAVGQIAGRAPNQKINLIGYSGGGAMAVLVAARRNDIASIRTVAGNLDHAEVNRINKVSPLDGSLNAIDVAYRVATIPQIHFSGAEDTIVPPAIAERFSKASASSCLSVRSVKGAAHSKGWVERWRGLLGERPACNL